MKSIKNILIKIFLFAIFAAMPGLAQNKINTSFEYSNHKIIINYDFQGDSTQPYNISLVLKRTSIPNFELKPELLTGDFGTGRYANVKRKIIWNLTAQEEESLTGDDYYFQINAELKKGGGIAWYVYVGGILLGGGAAAAVLLTNKKNETPASGSGTTLATPPGRPGN